MSSNQNGKVYPTFFDELDPNDLNGGCRLSNICLYKQQRNEDNEYKPDKNEILTDEDEDKLDYEDDEGAFDDTIIEIIDKNSNIT